MTTRKKIFKQDPWFKRKKIIKEKKLYYLGNNHDVKLYTHLEKQRMRDEVWDNVKAVHFSDTFYKSGYFEVSILKDLQARQTNKLYVGFSFCNMIIIFDVRSTRSEGKKYLGVGEHATKTNTVTPSFYYMFCSVLFMAVNCSISLKKYGNPLTSFSRKCITSRGHITLLATF